MFNSARGTALCSPGTGQSRAECSDHQHVHGHFRDGKAVTLKLLHLVRLILFLWAGALKKGKAFCAGAGTSTGMHHLLATKAGSKALCPNHVGAAGIQSPPRHAP
jgi:hypothetical protein